MKQFQNLFLNYIKINCKQIEKTFESKKYIISGYDEKNNIGIDFLDDNISINDIKNKEKIMDIDFIFNVENNYIRYVKTSDLIICEISNQEFKDAIKKIENNVFLFTNSKNWIWLTDRTIYKIEIENKIKYVCIGEQCSLEDVLENTCLKFILTDKGKKNLTKINNEVQQVDIIYGRCKESMYLLDDINRKYINTHKLSNNEIIGIKAVAGGGKTTTLLELSKIHNQKKILYIAFNKSLINEIKDKIKKQNIKNMNPCTFDALLYKLYINKKNQQPNIQDIKPQFIGNIVPFLKGKPYRVREYYCKHLKNFCNDASENNIEKYSINNTGEKKKLLIDLWSKVLNDELVTFETIRKIAYINHWFKDYIDSNYDMIMIDETQDFDMIMLQMLLNDTTIPKIFVGDNMQAIYQFRGCINAFEYLPSNSLIIEFYSTFRIGNPACDEIRNKFNQCHIISKSKNSTRFVNSFDDNEKYVYLFRSWRILLLTAEKTNKIWINSFDKKINEIKNLHNKLINYKNFDIDENTYEDDLPKFLKSISAEELENLLNNITNNLVDFKESLIKFYTVHSYKGLEDDNIRLANDININEDVNIYYVAITRSKKKILMDL